MFSKVIFAFSLLAFGCVAATTDLVIKNAEQKIDISSQLVKLESKLTFGNQGQSSQDSFTYVIPTEIVPKVSWFAVQDRSDEKKTLQMHKGDASPKGQLYKVMFPKALQPGKSIEVTVNMVLTHYLEPFPTKITQSQSQLVRYFGNAHVFIGYPIQSMTTTVALSSNNIESYTKIKPVSVADTTITYGPYENLAPFSKADVTIHYENNTPFLTITTLNRWIEVSHWGGNIAIEEELDVVHTGAKLKGSFSRQEYQRGQSGPSSVASYRTFLPAAANSVYYRDDIGNISTSTMRVMDDVVEVELRPRFPLFGGWKTKYTLGYNVPAYEYLYSSGENYVLEMRFIDHVYDEMVVEQATVSVVLPEGAENVHVSFPDYPGITRLPDKIFKTYLDTQGRTVVSATKDNLVENHIQEFQVRYRLPWWRLLIEPLLVVVAFYLLFLTVIVYVRLDFSISKDESSEAKMKASGIMESIVSVQSKREKLYQAFDSAIAGLKANKDSNAFQNTMRNLNNDHKNATQTVADYVTRLKGLNSPELVDRMNELQKLDRALKEVISQQVSLAERLTANKVTKNAYMTEEGNLSKKREELREKILALDSSF